MLLELVLFPNFERLRTSCPTWAQAPPLDPLGRGHKGAQRLQGTLSRAAMAVSLQLDCLGLDAQKYPGLLSPFAPKLTCTQDAFPDLQGNCV